MVTLFVALAIAATACSQNPSLKMGQAAGAVRGNVVTVPVTTGGIKLAAAKQKSSGKVAHIVVFIDREPTAAGAVIPRGPGIEREITAPFKIFGLSIGVHTFHVVLADNAQRRIGNLLQTLTVNVLGPSVIAQAPPAIKEGTPLKIHLTAQGVEIRKADGDTSGRSGHYHVLIDPVPPLAPRIVFRLDAPNLVIHSAQSDVTIFGLRKGLHHFLVVLGDGTHRAFDPPVMDKFGVIVT